MWKARLNKRSAKLAVAEAALEAAIATAQTPVSAGANRPTVPKPLASAHLDSNRCSPSASTTIEAPRSGVETAPTAFPPLLVLSSNLSPLVASRDLLQRNLDNAERHLHFATRSGVSRPIPNDIL